MRSGGRGGFGDDAGGEAPVDPGGLLPTLEPPPPAEMPPPSPHLALTHAAAAQLAEPPAPPLQPALVAHRAGTGGTKSV